LDFCIQKMTVATTEQETTYTAEALTQGELRRLWEMASMAGIGVAAGLRATSKEVSVDVVNVSVNKITSLTIRGEYATRLEAAVGLGR